MRILFFLLLFILSASAHLVGQDFCGTSVEVQSQMQPQAITLSQRNSTTYVPIRIHLVGDNEGNGLPNVSRVLDQMTRLNKDFEGTGIQFYMAGNGFFNIINDAKIYEDPQINVQDVIRNKSSNAMNVFVTKNTFNSQNGGTILGYYSGLGTDHIVMLNNQLSSSNNTLSHEVGHFFNLRHTFFGWEQEPYNATTHGNPLTLRLAPRSNVAVELVDKSNCATAADQVCDTPPDYNFGFAANGCRFTQQIRDPNNELVVTQEKNQMGYFNNCDEYFFTEGQYTRMFTSLMSASRSYVRLIYNPITAAIADKPIIVDLPAVIPTYNNVFIQWTPVPGATHYLVEFTDGRSYRYSIQSGTSVRTFDLEANRNYFVRVRPFNEYFTNTQTEIRTFRTGNILSSTSNNEDDQFLIDLIGNPISKGNRDIQFNIYSTMNFPATVKLFDVQGKLIRIENKQIESGTVLHSIPTSNLNTGLHILSVESEYGRITKKLIIY